MATLEVFTDSEGRQVVDLAAEQTVLGRYEFCDVVLRTHTISRQHARISLTGEQFYIEDLDSLNGTFVNGSRIDRRTALTDQDRIHLHETLVVFHTGTPPERTEPELKVATLPSADVLEGDSVVEMGGTLVSSRLRGEAEPADSQAAYLASLKITQLIGDATNLDDILPKVLDGVFELFPQADRGYLLLAEQPDGVLVPRAIKHRRDETGHSMTFGVMSRRTASRVMSEGKAILISDSSADSQQSVLDAKSLSLVCAPLLGPSQQPLGIIYVDTHSVRQRFTEEDLSVLVSVASVAGKAVELAGEHEAAMRLGRRKLELDTARQVQRHFLPHDRPIVKGYDFYDFYQSAEEIGGDYFGYIPLVDGRIVLAVGDVAGKGVSAALLMAHLSSEVRFALSTAPSAAAAMDSLNHSLHDVELENRFVTLVLCVLDPVRNLLTVVNAGHMCPIKRCGMTGKIQELGQTQSGLPLGCDFGREYQPFEAVIGPGDRILLYTDGINEARNPQDKLYGVEAVSRAFSAGPQNVKELGESLVRDVRQFCQGRAQSDDTCLVCFGRNIG